MVKHIILWQLREDIEDVARVKADMKRELEALAEKIEGTVLLRVHTEPLPPAANADVMLESAFTDADTYAAYIAHPLHQAAADNYVRPFVRTRLCMDYED